MATICTSLNNVIIMNIFVLELYVFICFVIYPVCKMSIENKKKMYSWTRLCSSNVINDYNENNCVRFNLNRRFRLILGNHSFARLENIIKNTAYSLDYVFLTRKRFICRIGFRRCFVWRITRESHDFNETCA